MLPFSVFPFIPVPQPVPTVLTPHASPRHLALPLPAYLILSPCVCKRRKISLGPTIHSIFYCVPHSVLHATGFYQRFLDVNSRARPELNQLPAIHGPTKWQSARSQHEPILKRHAVCLLLNFYFNHLHEAQGLRGSRRKFKLWDELGSFGPSFEFPEARVGQHVSLTYDCILWLLN